MLMDVEPMIVLLKLQEVCQRRAQRPTRVYEDVKLGRLAPPIKLTKRSSAWVEAEVDACTSAVVAGATDDELRKLVRQLIAGRARLMPRIEAA
jgi:prophage regulatory protein